MVLVVYGLFIVYAVDLQKALIFGEVSQHSQLQLRIISSQYHSTYNSVQEDSKSLRQSYRRFDQAHIKYISCIVT